MEVLGRTSDDLVMLDVMLPVLILTAPSPQDLSGRTVMRRTRP